MADTRWLIKRHKTWYAAMDVPRPLRSVVGRKRFVKSLHTHDLGVAVARRHAALAEFHREIEAAKRGPQGDDLVQEGLAWRDTLERIDQGDQEVIRGHRCYAERGPWEQAPTRQEDAREVALMALHDRIDDMRFHAGRPEDAATLAGIAQGQATPLMAYVDAWIREGGSRGPVAPRTAAQYRTDISTFAEWMASQGLPVLIERVTKDVAGRWVTDMVAKGEHRTTANRRVSAVSSYWRWLGKRTGHDGNPWTGQSLSRRRRPGEAKEKRSYMDEELLTLLSGDPGTELHDVIRIAALSAMRIEEIYLLRVADCAGAQFDIKRSKSPAGVRTVPIHSALAAVIDRRSKGKAPDDFLVHEAGPAPKPGRERSMPASKRFGRYRSRVGVTDKAEGVRQDRVDFHSFRRWFVTKARQAGNDSAVVAAVVGHGAGNITDDIYSGGPSEEQKRACVESVRLPTQGGS